MHFHVNAIKSLIFATMLALLAPSVASAQTKLYTDGDGLAITWITVQHRTGTNWVKASGVYEKNQRYRLRLKFKNFFNAGTPTLGAAYGHTGIHITKIVVTMEIVGARFETSQRKDTRFFLLRTFNDTIAPGQSRWFSCEEFTWVGLKPFPIHAWPVKLHTSHREIVYKPKASEAKLLPKN